MRDITDKEEEALLTQRNKLGKMPCRKKRPHYYSKRRVL